MKPDNPEKPATPPAGGWRAAAQAAYEQERDHWVNAALAPVGLPRDAATLVDFSQPNVAHLVIDGERFRVVASPFGATAGWFGPHVMLERPCAGCGTWMVSPWINSPAQLHSLLTHWHPRHWHCPAPATRNEE